MPGPNLTHAEAEERARLVLLHSYDVQLDLSEPTAPTYRSTTTIRFTCTEPGASTFVDLVAPTVREVSLNGVPLDPAEVYRDSRIELGDLAAENELRVVADCAYMNTGEGLHRTVDPADGRIYLYTHFEIPDARRVFATFEQPDLRAPVRFTVTAAKGWSVLSNSPTPQPEPLPDRDGIAVWHFPPTRPISTYITGVIAGEYHVVRDSYTAPDGQVIPLAVGCRTSLAPYLDPDEIFAVTKQGFDYYIEAFDQPYPFDKYDQMFVPEYNIGGMENVGLVTLTEHYLFRAKVTDAAHQDRAETILHELAHMWFGDLVTMRWWDDLWLKESFATYVSLRCLVETTKWPHSWSSFTNGQKAWGLRQDQQPSTHPIVAEIADLDDVALNFDGITYAKGAGVLKQLVSWVGSDQFFAGTRTYFARHAWGSTTLRDLLGALADASGRDLDEWSQLWLQRAGPNTLRASYRIGADGTYADFAITQEAPPEHPTLRSHRLAIGLYERRDGALVRTGRIELDVEGERTEVPELVGTPPPAVVLVNDDDLTYAALRLDDRSLATVVDEIADFTDAMPRALCWAATWDMVRAAELSASEYIRLVLGGIRAESDPSVVQTLHQNLVVTLERYVHPEHRGAAMTEVARAARRALAIAEPGGDLQLAWMRLLARIARDEPDLTFIDRVLTGAEGVPGLAVDTELRWLLLVSLVRAGWAGAAEIEAEAARDNTTAGAEYAAGAMAARPTAAAKADAWAAVIDRDDLPNKMQEAIIGGMLSRSGSGFGQALQQELTDPYIESYFVMLPRLWPSRTLEIARNIATGFFPRLRADDETLGRVDDVLARPDLPVILRRILVEGRADVVRNQRAQAFDLADRTIGLPDGSATMRMPTRRRRPVGR